MRIGVARESNASDRRVALIPADVPTLTKLGWEVVCESGAGEEAGYPDAQYSERGAVITPVGDDGPASADVVARIELPSDQPLVEQRGPCPGDKNWIGVLTQPPVVGGGAALHHFEGGKRPELRGPYLISGSQD